MVLRIHIYSSNKVIIEDYFRSIWHRPRLQILLTFQQVYLHLSNEQEIDMNNGLWIAITKQFNFTEFQSISAESKIYKIIKQ